MFTLHTVSISAGGPASPYHLVFGRFHFCQRYRLAAGVDWTAGLLPKLLMTLAPLSASPAAIYLVSLHYLIYELMAECIYHSVPESLTEKIALQTTWSQSVFCHFLVKFILLASFRRDDAYLSASQSMNHLCSQCGHCY